MQTWKTISKEIIFHHSKYLTVEDHMIELPDGRRIPKWCWIITYRCNGKSRDWGDQVEKQLVGIGESWQSSS